MLPWAKRPLTLSCNRIKMLLWRPNTRRTRNPMCVDFRRRCYAYDKGLCCSVLHPACLPRAQRSCWKVRRENWVMTSQSQKVKNGYGLHTKFQLFKFSRFLFLRFGRKNLDLAKIFCYTVLARLIYYGFKQQTATSYDLPCDFEGVISTLPLINTCLNQW